MITHKYINKIALKRLFIVLGIIITPLIVLTIARTAQAKNCGGEITCECGDTVTSSVTLDSDLGGNGSPCLGHGLIVGANNITIDGNNHTITGNGGHDNNGINNNNSFDNIVIRNFSNITNFASGIYLSGCTNSTFQNISVTANVNHGIYLNSSSSNTFTNNIISSNILNGLTLGSSPSNIFTGNSISGNSPNLVISGRRITDWNNTIDTTNTVEGKPILYLYDIHGSAEAHKIYSGDQADDGLGYEYVGDIGIFWSISCSYIDLKNATLTANNYAAVYFEETNNSTIQNVTTGSSDYSGIILDFSSANTLSDNTSNGNSNNGISVISSSDNILTNNTVNGNANNGILLVSSNSNIIDSNTAKENVYNGIDLNSSSFNTLSNNITNSGHYHGIHITSSSSNNLTSNTANQNGYNGIFIDSSSGASSQNTLTNNTANSNSLNGILLDGSGNTITGNLISKNLTDLYNTGVTNTYSLNKFSHNINSKMLTFTDVVRTKQLNEEISINASMFDPEGITCPDCTYTVTTSPSELVNTTKNGNDLTSSFSATRPGTYSLIFTITDLNGNLTRKDFSFFINASGSQTTTYYLRGIEPTRGQPSGSDAKSLLLTAPTDQETWTCGIWIQNSPNEIPNYPLANLSDVNIYSWYKQSLVEGAYIGIKRDPSYDIYVDYSLPVSAKENYTWVNKNFTDLNWGMDYPWSWYNLSLKLIGSDPYWTAYPDGQTNKSHADFVYQYTTSPTVKSVSNDSVIILSATASATSPNSAQIALNNPLPEATSTVITLSDFKYPFLNSTSTIHANDTTDLAVNLGGDANSILDTVPLNIIPSTGSVEISIDTWNTSGNYYKKWVETGSVHNISTQHTIGDLKPFTNYLLKVDESGLESFTSNSAGEISFTYTGGYSAKIFEVEESSTNTSSSGSSTFISPPATGSGERNISVAMNKNQDIGLVETTGINTLLYTGSSLYFQALVSQTDANENHGIKITDLDLLNNIVTLQIESERQIIKLKLKEEAKVDLNNDKIPDISVKFADLYVNRVELTIKSLLNQIEKTNPETKTNPNSMSTSNKYVFKRNLQYGARGADVKELQRYLNNNGFILTSSGLGSKGKETTFFGPTTRAALIKFQKNKKINPPAGYFGSITRKIVNK